MTRDNLVIRVRTNLDDLGAGFYNSDDTNDSLQDGYNLTAALAETIEKNVSVNYVGGLVYYDFSVLIPDFQRLYGIYNNDTNRWMEPINTIELYKLRDNYEMANGTPWWFQPIDAKYTMLFPVPTASSGSMTVMYKARADTMLGFTAPQLPSVNHNVLEFYSTADLLEQCEEFIKAMRYWGMYDKTLQDIQKLIRNRTSPNSLYYFKP